MILEGNDVKHFQFFAEQVKEINNRYSSMGKQEFLKKQEEYVNKLSALEIEFKDLLKKYGKEEEAFESFYKYITEEKRSLLVVRPFFRERSKAFMTGLIDGIRNRDYKKVFEYHFNFLFIKLISNRVDFRKNARIYKVIQEIEKVRWDLVLMNLPLVISRARIFYSRTPKSHLTFMDLVQIGVGGLLTAIDKYCGQYQKVWRGVVIGRIVGDNINEYNATVMHFHSDHHRVLYRAHKFFARNPKEDFNEVELLKQVNAGIPEKHWVTVEQIRQLILAAGIVSVDIRAPLDDEKESEDNVARLPAGEETRPDVSLELKEGLGLLGGAIKKLSIFDQKILRMKGVEIA